MAMNLRSGSGAGDPEVMMDINTTPLIDVMLVLLVIFIITAPLMVSAVKVDLPRTSAPAAPEAAAPTLAVAIDKDGILRSLVRPDMHLGL